MELEQVRRIVTGHDQTGRATILYDSRNPHSVARAGGGVSHLLWATDRTPAAMDGDADRAIAHPPGIPPATNGSVLRVVDFPPMSDDEYARLDVNFMAAQIPHNATSTSSKYRAPTHPFMHRTRTVDYAIVMAGEIDMLLDEGESIHVKAGDILVQQGTNHAWVNRGTAPCRIAFVLIDAVDPLE